MRSGSFWLSLNLILLCGAARADVQPDARPVTWTNCSGTVTGSPQAIQLGNPGSPVRGFFLQNPSTATESLWFEPSGKAANIGQSIELGAGDNVTIGPGTIFAGNQVSVAALTGGHPFVCEFGQ